MFDFLEKNNKNRTKGAYLVHLFQYTLCLQGYLWG